MNDKLTPQFSDIIFYSSPEGNIHVEVVFSNETFWLSQKWMAELFGGQSPPTITSSEPIKRLYSLYIELHSLYGYFC